MNLNLSTVIICFCIMVSLFRVHTASEGAMLYGIKHSYSYSINIYAKETLFCVEVELLKAYVLADSLFTNEELKKLDW